MYMYFGMKPAASAPLSLQKVQPVYVAASDILETANWTTQMNRAVCVVYQEFDAHLKTSTLKNDRNMRIRDPYANANSYATFT